MAGGPCGVPPEAALKILIHYGNTERPDKLHNITLVGRLDGHQNFSEQIYLPNVNLRPLKAGPARSWPAGRDPENFLSPNNNELDGIRTV